jgi:hypothetical protein
MVTRIAAEYAAATIKPPALARRVQGLLRGEQWLIRKSGGGLQSKNRKNRIFGSS